jgi:hypothetical protein
VTVTDALPELPASSAQVTVIVFGPGERVLLEPFAGEQVGLESTLSVTV